MRRRTLRAALALSLLLAAAPVTSISADNGRDGGGEVRQGDPLHQGDPLWMEHAAPDDDVARMGRAAMPFTAEQIEALGRLLRETQAAVALGGGAPPEGRIRRVLIGAPGEGAIPSIAVRKGYVTAVSFTDATGAPWPIERVLVDGRFLSETVLSETVRPAGGAEDHGGAGRGSGRVASHLLYLAPQVRSLHGNAVVKLHGLAEPLAAIVRGGGAEADFRVEIRLGLRGPNAMPEVAVQAAFHAGDAVLLDLLAGIAPPGAVRLAVDGGGPDDRAWLLGADLLLVTRSDLLSPGPWAAERGAGGRWAYRLADVPYALVSRDGRETRLAFRERSEIPGFPAFESQGERK